MKFKKFLKEVGVNGEVIERRNGDKWLVCGGVGMLIPRGVDNILGVNKELKYSAIVETLADAELDDPLTLTKAEILSPTGNAKSICRIFETELGDTVGIINGDYGLLEKSDLFGYGEIEVPDENEDVIQYLKKYVLVYDVNHTLQGFITGLSEF